MAKLFKGLSSRGVEIVWYQDSVDITSERATPNERWKFTDADGHEHYYDRGYPTLEYVVDVQHWCDGTEGFALHDPHMQVDRGHYECMECRVIIEPLMDPPMTPKVAMGLVTVQATGYRDDGWKVTVELSSDEVAELTAFSHDPIQQEAIALRVINTSPHVISSSFSS